MVRLGPFTLEAALHRGGIGEVWRAQHTRSRIPAAVKVVLPALAADPRHAELLRREVEIHARLAHPAIIQPFDAGVVDAAASVASGGRLLEGQPWMAMEWAAGGSLSPLTGRMPLPALRVALRQVLGALAHAHARGVLHLDVKPGNILLAQPGVWEVRLADFGISNAFRERGGRGVVGWSDGFAAPEQRLGRYRDYGPPTDLFALGRTAAVLAGAALGQWPGLESWIELACSPSPHGRFATAADALRALDALGPTPVASADGQAGDEALTVYLDSSVPESEPGPPAVSARAAGRAPLGGWRRALPERTFALTDAGIGLFPFRPLPVVGRDGAIDAVWAELAAVVAGGGCRFVVLRGPGGVGRSRLAEWLCERAEEHGAARRLRVEPSGDADPLGAALARFARLDRIADAGAFESRVDAFARLEGVGAPAALAELVRPGSGVSRLRTPEARLRTATGVLADLAARRPLLVWTAPALLPLAEALAGALAGSDVLVLAESDGPAPATATVVEVGPPPPEISALFVQELLPLTSSSCARVLAWADGRLELLHTLVAGWARDGRLVLAPDGYRLAGPADLPRSADEAVAAAVDRLRGAAPDVWRAATVLALLDRPSSAAEAEVGPVGAALVESGLASWDPATEVGWAWAAGVREELRSRADDRALHRRAFEVAAATGASRAAIALHAIAARLPDALVHVSAAVQESSNTGDYTAAVRVVGAAEVLVEGLPDDDPRRGALRLDALLTHLNRGDTAQGEVLALIADADRHGWIETGVRARVARGRRLQYAGDPEGPRMLADAAERASRAGLVELRAQINLDLGRIARDAGDLEEADRLLALAVEGRLRVGGVAADTAVRERINVLGMLGRSDEALALLATLPDTSERYLLLGEILRHRGDRAEAEAAYRTALETAHPWNEYASSLSRLNLGTLLAEDGDPEEAAALLAAALAWALRAPFAIAERIARAGLALVAARQADAVAFAQNLQALGDAPARSEEEAGLLARAVAVAREAGFSVA